MTSSINSESSTTKSLERALESNLRLQAQLARRVETIAQKKASNRRLASRITSQIVSTWNEMDDIRKPLAPIAPKVRSKKRKKDDNTGNADSQQQEKKYTAKWNYDPYRKWTRRFFVDPDDSIPERNEDIAKRRKMEEGKFFYHDTSAPWSKKEVQTLLSIVADKTKETNGEAEDSVDFDNVAQTLEERMKTDKNRLPTVQPRSGADCRLKYADTRKQHPFTKEESMKVLEQVHLHNGTPPWPEVAANINRSTWQCLSTYKTKLTSSRSLPFTKAEDEVLLKIAAAAGPQFVLNIGVAADLAARFFPHRSPKQVLARMNGSLLNPNFAREVWSDEEERRLVLCMKVYRGAQFPLTGAAVHFPDRSSKAVSEKWDRSLNPAYTSKPFTPAEDKILLEAVRESPGAGWAELTKLFTSRHPRSLNHRWNEIATEEDLLLKYGTKMKQEGARRGVVKSDGLLSSDDFVVRLKQEPDEERE